MNQITVQKDLVELLPAQFQPYVISWRTPDLKSTNRVENLKSIYKSIIIAMEYTGSVKAEDNGATKYLAEKFYEEVMIKFPFARHGEIEMAFKKGALKEYGDYFGINVQTLYQWYKKHLESNEYLAAKRAFAEVRDINLGTVDKPVGAMKIPKEAIIGIFKEFKESGELPVYAWVYYDEILKIKGVKTLIEDKEQRKEIVKQAKFEFENRLKAKKYHKKEPDNFNILMNSITSNQTYIGICGKIALTYYFNDLINKGKELEL